MNQIENTIAMESIEEEGKEEVEEKRGELLSLSYINTKEFYAKKITMDDIHTRGNTIKSTDILTKIAMLVGMNIIEKYKLNTELKDTIAWSQYEVISHISNGDINFFSKAFFHKSDPATPLGIMFGNYIEDINVTISNILYVKPEYRIYGLEKRLIDNFIWWSKKVKHTPNIFIERMEEVDGNGMV